MSIHRRQVLEYNDLSLVFGRRTLLSWITRLEICLSSISLRNVKEAFQLSQQLFTVGTFLL